MNRIPGRITVELDDEASALLSGYMGGEEQPCIKMGADPRDVASAAMLFFLDDPDTSDWDSTAEVLEQTEARRLAMGSGRGEPRRMPVLAPVDNVAAGLLARFVRVRGDDARDVVNASLVFLLSSWLDDDSRSASECVAAARARRLASKRKELR